MILRNLLIQSSPVKDIEGSKLLIKNNNLMDCGKDKQIHQLNKLCDETLEWNCLGKFRWDSFNLIIFL